MADRKLVSDLKLLTDGMGNFRQWNVKLANALIQVDERYGDALHLVMAIMDQGKDADEGLEEVIFTSVRAVGELPSMSDAQTQLAILCASS